MGRAARPSRAAKAWPAAIRSSPASSSTSCASTRRGSIPGRLRRGSGGPSMRSRARPASPASGRSRSPWRGSSGASSRAIPRPLPTRAASWPRSMTALQRARRAPAGAAVVARAARGDLRASLLDAAVAERYRAEMQDRPWPASTTRSAASGDDGAAVLLGVPRRPRDEGRGPRRRRRDGHRLVLATGSRSGFARDSAPTTDAAASAIAELTRWRRRPRLRAGRARRSARSRPCGSGADAAAAAPRCRRRRARCRRRTGPSQ